MTEPVALTTHPHDHEDRDDTPPSRTTMVAAQGPATVRIPMGQIAVLLDPDIWVRVQPILAKLAMAGAEPQPALITTPEPSDTMHAAKREPTETTPALYWPSPQDTRPLPPEPHVAPATPQPTLEPLHCSRCTHKLSETFKAERHYPLHCLWRPSVSDSQPQWRPSTPAT